MKKHLEFYKQCMEAGRLASHEFGSSLCAAADADLIDKQLLRIMQPTDRDEFELTAEGYSNGWWGSGVPVCSINTEEKWFGFTPLRQTIVLFMAAMNNEL